MSFIVEPNVEEYAAEHTSPDGELFERLAAETREKMSSPQMMVGRIEGQFLARLVRLSGAKRILELGTFTGYSSISMASALPAEGTIITCDVDPEATSIARRYMDESGNGDKNRENCNQRSITHETAIGQRSAVERILSEFPELEVRSYTCTGRWHRMCPAK